MNIEGGIHLQRLQTYFVFTITEKNLCSLRTHLLILLSYINPVQKAHGSLLGCTCVFYS
jgi:hypothetical protein